MMTNSFDSGRTVGRGLPELPPDWTVESTHRVGPFITRARLQQPEGHRFEWTLRNHRKRLTRSTEAEAVSEAAPVHRSPSASCWWMAVLFAGGASCFALGSLPLYFNAVQPSLVALTFFGGSVLFTCASAIQYVECRTAPTSLGSDQPKPRTIRRVFGISPGRLDWWATAIQLGGTVLFNLSTFAALQSDLSTSQARRLIWAPDVLGSVCFLVASWLCYLEVNHRVRPSSDGSTGWQIAALNMIGSIAFGAAAIAARYLPTTGEPANLMLVNSATFLGAVCFLCGAILLPVESSKGASDAPAA